LFVQLKSVNYDLKYSNSNRIWIGIIIIILFSCTKLTWKVIHISVHNYICSFLCSKVIIYWLKEHPEWEIKNGSVFFQKAKESAPCKEIPSLQLINQTLSYARELERIVWKNMRSRLLCFKISRVWIIAADIVFWNCLILIQCRTKNCSPLYFDHLGVCMVTFIFLPRALETGKNVSYLHFFMITWFMTL